MCQEKKIMEVNKNYKSGFVSVIGRPNVGKSTLINSLIGQKVVIMSDKPQTTRNKIMCVLTLDDAQILFIDTPGIHKPKHKLGEYMLKAAENTLREVDVIFFVVDATEDIGGGERYILDLLALVKTPVILVVNKIDKIEKTKLLPIIQKYSACYNFVGVVPISAMEHTNLDHLIVEVKKYLDFGPQYYPEDMITDQPERLVIAEMIREKVLHATRDEIPHSIAVDIEEITTRANEDLYIRAVVYVERESQKGIVIGAKGQLLKEVGKLARADIENLLGSKIFLDLWVKVKKDWRNKEGSLRSFGYE
jgi:GTP-binding protein Era